MKFGELFWKKMQDLPYFMEYHSWSSMTHVSHAIVVHDSWHGVFPWVVNTSSPSTCMVFLEGSVVFWLVVLLQTPNFSATKVHQICNGEFMEWKNNTWNVHVCLKILHGYICTAQFRSFRRIFGDFKPAT